MLIFIVMLKKIKSVIKYAKYYRKAKTAHGVHSPFVFDFIKNVIYDKKIYPEYNKIEAIRKRLLSNRNIIETVDFGAAAGKAGYKTAFQRVSDIARKSSIKPKDGKLLFRIVRFLKPEIILELGTSVGMSSIYQVMASPDSFFIGIEGCASTAHIAEQNMNRINPDNYSFIIGHFDNTLPGVLEKLDKLYFAFVDGNHAYKPTVSYFEQLLAHKSENSVFIFHDIHWSDDMERAWEYIKAHPQVTVTIDLYRTGLVFFRQGIPKQDFIILF